MSELKETIILSNQDVCQVSEINAFCLAKAMYRSEAYNNSVTEENKVTAVPFLILESILINDEKTDINYVFNLSIQDYTEITDITSVFMFKLKF